MEEILGKLKSRKFWVLIGYAFVALVGDELGLDTTNIKELGYAVMSYLGFQGAVDFIGAKK